MCLFGLDDHYDAEHKHNRLDPIVFTKNPTVCARVYARENCAS
jgi:hypothetical protein